MAEVVVETSKLSEKLYFEIVKFQSEQKLEWSRACDMAAALIDMNTSEFERRVQRVEGGKKAAVCGILRVAAY